MAAKAFTIKRLDQFLEIAEVMNTPKFLDTENKIAFFNARYKRIEYKIQDSEDEKRLLSKGFIEGIEREVFDSW